MSQSIPYQTAIPAALNSRFQRSRSVLTSPPPIFGNPAPGSLPIQSGIALSVAIATTTSSAFLLHNPSTTELRFELALRSAETTSIHSPSGSEPHYADVRPEVDQDTLIHVLQSQKVLAPVVADLQQQDIDLSYRRLKQGLELQTLDNGNLEVRYQHTDSQVAQQVTARLSRAYVAYGQECHIDACHTLPAINAEIKATQTRIEQAQHSLAAFSPGGQTLEQRAAEVTARIAEIERHLNQVQQEIEVTHEHYNDVRSHLSFLKNSDIQQYLGQQSAYQDTLQQLQAVEYQLAIQQMDSQPNPDQIQDLLAHHKALMVELSQHVSAITKLVRTDYVERSDHVKTNLSALKRFDSEIASLPFSSDRDRLEQAILLAHHVNLLDQRQQALSPVHDLLQRREVELISQMRDRDELNRQLYVDQHTLKQHQHQRQQLQQDIEQTKISWQIVSPPEMMLSMETGSLEK